jgi:hypothetical protein
LFQASGRILNLDLVSQLHQWPYYLLTSTYSSIMLFHGSYDTAQTSSQELRRHGEADNSTLNVADSTPQPQGLSKSHTNDTSKPSSKTSNRLSWLPPLPTAARSRITDEEWEWHKEAILRQYLVTDHTLQDTIAFMKQSYDFEATYCSLLKVDDTV